MGVLDEPFRSYRGPKQRGPYMFKTKSWRYNCHKQYFNKTLMIKVVGRFEIINLKYYDTENLNLFLKSKTIVSATFNETHREKFNAVQEFIKVKFWLLLIFSIYLRSQLKFHSSIEL